MNKPLKYSLFLACGIGIVQFIAFGLFFIITKNLLIFSPLKIILFVIFVIISAVLTAYLIINIVPYFKNFVLDERQMIRFQSLSHPLLLQLSLEAPGTYHHSLMVANLAYKAAQAIKADTMLVRVGAYYHDVGKLINPFWFIENQDKIINNNNLGLVQIKKDAKNIISHVSFGLELAKRHNLPTQIMAFIAEHHGTTTTLFFLTQAQKINPKINPDYFTYPGPKPLSVETALVMLSDAIEAKLRLCKDIDKQIVIQTVEEIINERLSQKQLELSGITFAQIKKVRSSLIKTLLTIHHQRIDYVSKL